MVDARGQLYYQNYVQLSPILTMVRMLPMFVTGVACNVVIALIIGRVDVMYIVGASLLPSPPSPPPPPPLTPPPPPPPPLYSCTHSKRTHTTNAHKKRIQQTHNKHTQTRTHTHCIHHVHLHTV